VDEEGFEVGSSEESGPVFCDAIGDPPDARHALSIEEKMKTIRRKGDGKEQGGRVKDDMSGSSSTLQSFNYSRQSFLRFFTFSMPLESF
jgi:hypothetical protein